MKKRWLFIVLLLQAGSCLLAQTTIVQWNFNNNMNPSSGQMSATIGLVGGVDSTHYGGVSFDNGNPNNALGTSSYPTPGAPAKTDGIQINLNTLGYQSIHLKLYSQHSGAAANKVVVQHLVGNVPFDDTFYIKTTAGSYNTTQYDFNLSAYTVLNNSSSISLRLVTDFGTSNAYQGISTGYNSNGTIRYDLIEITGTPTTCSTLATQQATGLRLLKTDNFSAQLTLNRGNGNGCLVLCSTNTPPNTAPNGVNYTANSNYTNGTPIGNAFAVYNTQVGNPSTHYFNITGLTAGTKYYVAAYEYSSSGYCYLNPGTVDSFYCNSTILYPGDLQFVGYDDAVASGGVDAFAITNLKAINPGTFFQIANGRFESGAAANIRTQRWYAGSNLHGNLESIDILYAGTVPLAAGSVLSFDFAAPSGTNIKINNQPSSLFTIGNSNVTGNSSILNNSAAEQFFLTQGRFKAYGVSGSTQYYLLDGHVLHGITYINDWVGFNTYCDSTQRKSRIPTDINCLKLYFSTSGYAYYNNNPATHTGSQGLLLGNIANAGSNWTSSLGSTTANDISGIYNSPFTITSAPTTANWTGGAGDGNWFNCSNWENLYVPDSTATVSVAATPVAGINGTATSAIEYGGLAVVRNLNITNTVSLSGNSADKLIVYDSLKIGTTGTLTTSGTAIDTIIVRGSIQSLDSVGLQLKTNGWLSLQGNRQIQPINVSLARTVTPDSVIALSLNNPPGININTGGFESLKKLELTNGILSPVASAFHYLDTGCSISCPNSYYGSGEPNIGWEKSYIDGKVFVRTNAIRNYTAPLGSKQKGVFAPMVIQPSTANSFVYEAGYIGMSHPDAANFSNPPIYKVSTQEYWTLVCRPFDTAYSAAKLTLYYTPLSFVGAQGAADSTSLRDLRIVQYRDTTYSPSRKWRLPSASNLFPPAGPDIRYGKISIPNGEFAFSLTDGDKCFTLGSTSFLNTLPLQVVRWAAQLQGSRTLLSWQVQQEAGTAFYTVEKSVDGKTFHPLQTVYAAGLPAYACYDDAPADGWNYYRLKIVDANGKGSYTTIEKVWLKQAAPFTVFPNPASDKLFVSLPSAAKATLRLYAPDGRKCMEQTTATTSFTSLNVKGLPAGWYLLEYTDGKSRLVQKVMVK